MGKLGAAGVAVLRELPGKRRTLVKARQALARSATMGRFLFLALPQVARELAGWHATARQCVSPELRAMALASLGLKRFHCQGGSVFAARVGPGYGRVLVRAIVALQTISDYLDNLCDRLGVEDEKAFRRLHQAFLDALIPGEPLKEYYAFYPYRDDGGYLAGLVVSCQKALALLPSYSAVMDNALELAYLYANLQATKHLAPGRREERLLAWLAPLSGGQKPPLSWWELAAATGSTLGIFGLFALAAGRRPAGEEISLLKEIYFPWIGGLHILLDYFIDLEEDRRGGDLNFVSYYANRDVAVERLLFFVAQCRRRIEDLPDPVFHLTVIQGLLALYLSDSKVEAQGLAEARDRLLAAGGAGARRLYRLCRFLRRLGVV